ncbi:MAG: LLM class flavin-dependent oxidoreductase [Gammaproteobacteria bacterium]
MSLSILDLCPITEHGSAARSLANSLDLARRAERWGYRRYWVAEHHNMPGIASAATAVVIAHIAGGTNTIRVGAGGMMLPNHAPLVVAEQFGTLAALFPGRIDLGLGRAPGTDPRTAYALRRNLTGDVDDFPRDVVELQSYFLNADPDTPVRAIPGQGQTVPIWILGSSLYGAQLAAALGLPYAFASHFAPGALMQALEVYRSRFKPSEQLSEPYAMAGFNVFAAQTQARAHYLRTSARKFTLALRRGRPGALPPPDDTFEENLSPAERAMLDEHGACSAVGSPDTVRAQMQAFVAETGVNELIITAMIHDHEARLRSVEIAMTEWKKLAEAA